MNIYCEPLYTILSFENIPFFLTGQEILIESTKAHQLTLHLTFSMYLLLLVHALYPLYLQLVSDTLHSNFFLNKPLIFNPYTVRTNLNRPHIIGDVWLQCSQFENFMFVCNNSGFLAKLSALVLSPRIVGASKI